MMFYLPGHFVILHSFEDSSYSLDHLAPGSSVYFPPFLRTTKSAVHILHGITSNPTKAVSVSYSIGKTTKGTGTGRVQGGI
jgi:hypothetical protein